MKIEREQQTQEWKKNSIQIKVFLIYIFYLTKFSATYLSLYEKFSHLYSSEKFPQRSAISISRVILVDFMK